MSGERFIIQLEGDAAGLAKRPREVMAAICEPSGAALVEEIERVLGPGLVLETRLIVARPGGGSRGRRRRGGDAR